MRTTHLVFDIETVVDGGLVAKVKYPGESFKEPCSFDAIRKYEEELKAAGKDPFVPLTYHVPVCLGIAKLAEDLSLQDLLCLDVRESLRDEDLVKAFWAGVGAYKPTLVTFNGRGFDLPVLTMRALLWGISCPEYFGNARGGYRYRYGERHLDLMDWLTDWGAWRLSGGLDLCSRIVGGGGKRGDGAAVSDLFWTGQHGALKEYCLRDVGQTWRLFLQTRVLTGEISDARAGEMIDEAREKWGEEVIG